MTAFGIISVFAIAAPLLMVSIGIWATVYPDDDMPPMTIRGHRNSLVLIALFAWMGGAAAGIGLALATGCH